MLFFFYLFSHLLQNVPDNFIAHNFWAMCLHNDVFCCSFLWYSKGTVQHPSNSQLDTISWVEPCQCRFADLKSSEANPRTCMCLEWKDYVTGAKWTPGDSFQIRFVFNCGSHCHRMWWMLQDLEGSEIQLVIVMDLPHTHSGTHKQTHKKGL